MGRRARGYTLEYRGPSRGYYVRFTAAGKRYHLRLHTHDRADAEKLAAANHAMLAAQEHGCAEAIRGFIPLYPPALPGVYAVRDDTTGRVKVGRSTNIADRIKKLQTGSASPLYLVAVLSLEPGHERAIHRRLRTSTKSVGEWFMPSPELVSLLRLARGRA